MKWWLLRAVLYYASFEALAPFAILASGWPRIGEGLAFAVVAASVHPQIRRRFAGRIARPS